VQNVAKNLDEVIPARAPKAKGKLGLIAMLTALVTVPGGSAWAYGKHQKTKQQQLQQQQSMQKLLLYGGGTVALLSALALLSARRRQ
jgi:hypothetical protein